MNAVPGECLEPILTEVPADVLPLVPERAFGAARNPWSLVFFDGKTYPHYARRLLDEADVRVVAVMNFYTRSCPESTRPPELNRHRFGDA